MDGIVCDHLAFAGPGIEWQIWLGPEKDPLPRRLAVTYLTLERQPRFLVNLQRLEPEGQPVGQAIRVQETGGRETDRVPPAHDKIQ